MLYLISTMDRVVVNRTMATTLRCMSAASGNNVGAVHQKESKSRLKPRHFIPRAERSMTNSLFKIDHSYDDRLVRYSRDSPTRELNYGPENWKNHKSVWRRVRHVLSTLGSSPLQRLIFPDLAVTASVAAGLTYYNEVLFSSGVVEQQLAMGGAAMAGATTAIGLLSAFRLNASYGRYSEARRIIGEVNNTCRNLGGIALMWLEPREEKLQMLNLIKAFPVALHWHLNAKGGHYMLNRADPNFKEQVSAEFVAEMKDIFVAENDRYFIKICRLFQQGDNVPLAISTWMRSIIVNNSDYIEPIHVHAMNEEVDVLVDTLGMAERVLRTPIPTCFTRHTSRLLFLWSNLIPFALYPALGPIGTLPASLALSYSILGIEDIGVQLEEPFNILPMRQFSEGIYGGVETMKRSYDMQKAVAYDMRKVA